MATATQTRYTPEDLLKINDRSMPELVDGQLVEREMGQIADLVAARLIEFLGAFVRAHQLGIVNSSQCGFQIFPDDRNKVRIPDASFTSRDRLAASGPARGHAKVAPDLVVEVVSPNDDAINLLVKIGEYLGAGVSLIWVANPDDRSVFIYRADGSGTRLGPEAELDGGEVVPGFRWLVADLFVI